MLVLSVSFSLTALVLLPTVMDPGRAHEQIYASSDFERNIQSLELPIVPGDPQQVPRLLLRMRRNMQRRHEETIQTAHTSTHMYMTRRHGLGRVKQFWQVSNPHSGVAGRIQITLGHVHTYFCVKLLIWDYAVLPRLRQGCHQWCAVF